jgi:capsular exopolysaccharide synthesis family protein
MSKIFEVLSKDNVLDFGEVSDGAADAQQSPEHADEAGKTSAENAEQVNVVTSPAPAKTLERTVSLQVSALTPVFPFLDEAQSAAAEQYRIIRTKLLHSARKPQLVVVSSPSSGDGKTITSINIAAALSLKENLSVLLVDADLRRPMVAELLGIPSAPGLAEVLSGRVSLGSAVVRAREFPNLCILPAGEGGHSATELLHSERWRLIIQQFRSQFDVVIMDATPIAVVADYELLQHVSDGVIVVVRPDHTERKACTSALQAVPKEKFIGIVLNCMKDWWLSKTYDYDYYGKKPKSAGRNSVKPSVSISPGDPMHQSAPAE